MQESSISEKIKELRTDLKMNQKNFSAAIGIRQSTLSSYEMVWLLPPMMCY
mgnify:CR=1 FL=1